MDYETAMDEETMVSRAQAKREIFAHYHGNTFPARMAREEAWADFKQDFGEHLEYRAADVLMWLGW